MNILFSSTSFLPPTKKLWKNLNLLSSKLYFDEYNNITMTFNKINNYDSIILLIFLQDINFENKKNLLDIILENLIFCTEKNRTVFVAISSYFYNNLIRASKHQSSNELKFIEFKKNIYDISKKNPNLFIIDLDILYRKIGYENIFDTRNWLFSRLRLSNDGIQITDEGISSVIARSILPEKKLLVLDCDNTIWGGVVGEDGYDGILLGNEGIGLAYKEFQKEIKKLKSEGLILAICSKNNDKDVSYVLENNPEMVLKKNDIVSFRINWREKAENIESIAKELSIGLDSIAFWDDNPLEREKIKNTLSEVFVFNVPNEIDLWPKLIAESDIFAKNNLSQEDLKKTEQYKARAQFKELQKKSFDKYDFLKQIGLKPKINNLEINDINRAVQLCKKTNQFNLSTKRYSEKDLISFLNSENYDLFIISAIDRFGDHGKIGLAIIKYIDNKTYLDSFMLSCRILGRDIEFWFLQTLLNKIKKNGKDFLFIEYQKTDRNYIVKEFLESCKFIMKDTSLQQDNTYSVNVSTDSKIIEIESLYE